ncbi:carbonic anhydrase [Pseudozyma hubeiensis SY62]|uniref:carbonic anhydrase n=1 Tax=Pseudozyma hubeiensis (strain SY62) TaxID=1305764 RepID=R9PFC7_PSEHS|nr:carbonic anhydrase [Pseudozyma hubeiensis SY62]GAC96780.1 carbonic anhydrase [Pseudozyma hubeiensis SY62]
MECCWKASACEDDRSRAGKHQWTRLAPQEVRGLSMGCESSNVELLRVVSSKVRLITKPRYGLRFSKKESSAQARFIKSKLARSRTRTYRVCLGSATILPRRSWLRFTFSLCVCRRDGSVWVESALNDPRTTSSSRHGSAALASYPPCRHLPQEDSTRTLLNPTTSHIPYLSLGSPPSFAPSSRQRRRCLRTSYSLTPKLIWMYTALPPSSLFSVARRHSSPSHLVQRLVSTRSLTTTTTRITLRHPTTTRSHSTASSSCSTSSKMQPVAELISKNKAWSADFISKKPELAAHLAQKQTPKMLWFGCADSRVPETTVCDAQPGDFFVSRNIANQFRTDDTAALALLTFAVQSVGIEHVCVVGHSMCGGVLAALGSADAPPSDKDLAESALLQHLVPLFKVAKKVKDANPDLPKDELAFKVVQASVEEQIDNIVNTQIIKDNWNGVTSPLSGKVMNKVQVHGLYFDIAKQELVDLNMTKSAP